MATRKLTITLDVDQVDRVRMLVESGAAPSVFRRVPWLKPSASLDDKPGSLD